MIRKSLRFLYKNTTTKTNKPKPKNTDKPVTPPVIGKGPGGNGLLFGPGLLLELLLELLLPELFWVLILIVVNIVVVTSVIVIVTVVRI